MTAPTDFGISLTSTLTYLNALPVKIPRPKSPFQPYGELHTMQSGKVIGVGWATITWQWGFLTRAQRNQLRTFCTAASGLVYISSRQNDVISTVSDEFVEYLCRVTWPLGEDREATRRMGFKLVFTRCVPI